MRGDELKYTISATASKYDRVINNSMAKTKVFDGSVINLKGSLAKLGPAAAAAGGAAALGAFVLTLKSGVETSAEWERRLLRTESLIKATGNAAGLSANELSVMAKELDLLTLGDRDNIMDAINALQTFKSVSGDTFRDTIRLAGDLSETLGTDLRSQTVQLGKALEDPVRGLNSLRRVGVTFTEDQKALIKSLWESGRAAEAQSEILKVIDNQVGGAAAGAASGLSGKIDTLTYRWREFKEQLADTTGAAETASSGIDLVSRSLERMTKALEGPDQITRLQRRLTDLEEQKDIFKDIGNMRGLEKIEKKITDVKQQLEQARMEAMIFAEDAWEYPDLPSEMKGTEGDGATVDEATLIATETKVKFIKEAHQQLYADLAEMSSLEAARELEATIEHTTQINDAEMIAAETRAQMIKENKEQLHADMMEMSDIQQGERIAADQVYFDWIQAQEYDSALQRGSISEWLTSKFVSDEGKKNKEIGKMQKAAAVGAVKNLGDTFALMAGQSKTAFEAHKAYKISEATITGYDAAVKAWNAGMATGGPWAPAVAAAYTAASLGKTGALIASIKSQQYAGGGGGATGGVGSVGTASFSTSEPTLEPAIAETQERPNTTIIVEGPFTSEETADYLFGLMKENYEERDVDFVFTGSGGDL